MASTPKITAGVKIVKISKTDALGRDITLQLQEAQTLRLQLDDVGMLDFTIISIREYVDHFLFYVEPLELGTQVSTGIQPTSLASGGSGFISGGVINILPSPANFPVGALKGFAILSNKTNWTFDNTTTGLWTSISAKTPFSMKVSFTCSVYADNNSSRTLQFWLSGSNTNSSYLTSFSNASGSSNAVTVSGSLNITSAEFPNSKEFGVRLSHYYGTGNLYIPTNTFYLNLESLVTSSTDNNGVLTVVEPYVSENVSTSDYNAIINNATQGRVNDFYMDVDYSSNAIIAVNDQAILDGNATRAEVQHSNYTTARIVNPRYAGSRNTSPAFNVGVSGSVPAVESDGTFFAYFDWVGGTTPELIDKAGYHVKYLIDSDANVYTPNLTSSYYYNLIDVFNKRDNVNVLFQAGSTSGNVDNLQGVHPVIKSGGQPRAIIFSQTGSSTAALSEIFFASGTVTHNYAGIATIDPDLIQRNLNTLLDITGTTVSPTDLTFNTSGDYAKVITTDPNITITPQIALNFTYEDTINGYDGEAIVTFEKSTNGGTSWSTYSSQTFYLDNSYTATMIAKATPETAVSGSAYRAKIVYNSVPPSVGAEFTVNSGNWSVTQNPVYGATVSSGSGNNYWITGSQSPRVLTGSQFTTAIYGGQQQTVSGSGYDAPYLPFNLQAGDEIRFSRSENSVYMITNVNEPAANANNTLYLTLDKDVIAGTNLNSFLIRRFNPNPSFVIVDSVKDSDTGGGSGFLLPEYASTDITDRFDEIIKNLTEKGLI
jgi:hypothetical protein